MAVVINGTTGVSTPGLTNSSTTTNTGNVTNSGTVTNASTISVGNATPSASGAGITFPATQSASTDANTLDDYEEGTWTPKSGTNITVSQAKYVKIGKVVTVSASIKHTGNITAYDQISLPFTPDMADADSRYVGIVEFFDSGTGVSVVNILLVTQQNQGANPFFWAQTTAGAEQWPYAITYTSGNGITQYSFQMTYFTTT